MTSQICTCRHEKKEHEDYANNECFAEIGGRLDLCPCKKFEPKEEQKKQEEKRNEN